MAGEQFGMTDYTGASLYAEFDGVAISADFRRFELPIRIGDTDASAGGDEYESFLTTRKRLEWTAEFLEQVGSGTAGGNAAREKLRVGVEGSLIWGPQGTASGKPKYSMYLAILESTPVYVSDAATIRRVRGRNKLNSGLIDDFDDPTKRSVW
jgi:hypothetical protein